MAKAKLQIFISSTYLDLRDERQAAVEAILLAGHIPAGMELFAADDRTQLEVIRRWISESDVFLLILGGRYGSIDSETGKSYTHLEYEYAVANSKPHFSLIIDDHGLEKRFKKRGREVIEQAEPKKLGEFRSKVMKSICRMFSDIKDVHICVMESLRQFESRPEIVGWIRGEGAGSRAADLQRIADLTSENNSLKTKVAELERGYAEPTYLGGNFTSVATRLRRSQLKMSLLTGIPKYYLDYINSSRQYDSNPNNYFDLHSYLAFMWLLRKQLAVGLRDASGDSMQQIFIKGIAPHIILEGLIEKKTSFFGTIYRFSKEGKQFILELGNQFNKFLPDKIKTEYLDDTGFRSEF